MVTERGDMDPIVSGYLQDRLIRPCSQFFTIDRQFQHSLRIPPFTPTLELPPAYRQAGIRGRELSIADAQIRSLSSGGRGEG